LKAAVDKYHMDNGGKYEQILKPQHKISPKDMGISSTQETLEAGSYINEKGDLIKRYKRKKKSAKPKSKRCRCK
jgi:hypothetical protein